MNLTESNTLPPMVLATLSANTSSSPSSRGNTPLYPLYCLLSTLTLLSCLLSGYLTLKTKDVRDRPPSQLFYFSLLLNIGLIALVSLVLVLLLLTGATDGLTKPMCYVRIFQRYLSLVSCYTLVCLALERYLFLCKPLRFYQLLPYSTCRLLCGLCWLGPLVLFIVTLGLQTEICSQAKTDWAVFVMYSVLYTLGALVTFTFYLLVAIEFRCRKPRTERRGSVEEQMMVRRTTTRSALTILTYYILLSLPHTLLPLIKEMTWVPSWLMDAGYISHRVHLLLFLPIYASTSSTFSASLRALGNLIMRRLSCVTSSPSANGQVRRHSEEVSVTQPTLGDDVV